MTNEESIDRKVAIQMSRFMVIEDIAKSTLTEEFKALNVHELSTKLDILETYWDRFSLFHEKFVEVNSDEVNKHQYMIQGRFAQCMSNYSRARSNMLQAKENKDPLYPFARPSRDQYRKVLPPIKVTPFSGEFHDWRRFHDSFKSLVIDNKEISAVERMHYLKEYVVGEAAKQINNIAISETAFDAAWDTIVRRFDNKRLLVSTYLDNILSIKDINSRSPNDLNSLLVTVHESLAALKALGSPVQYWDQFIVHIMVQKLDHATRVEWEIEIGASTECPSYEKLRTFLTARARARENLARSNTSRSSSPTHSKASAKTQGTIPKDSRSFSRNVHHSSATTQGQSSSSSSKEQNQGERRRNTCSFCNGAHYISFCPKFTSKPIDERRKFIEEKELCYNCLGPHYFSRCKIRTRCKLCDGTHHTLIHIMSGNSGSSGSSHGYISRLQPAAVLLATAQAILYSLQGTSSLVRILIDPGSELSFISEKLVNILHISRSRSSISLLGIGGAKASNTRGIANFCLCSRYNSSSMVQVAAHVLPKLTSWLPTTEFDDEILDYFKGLDLADPAFNKSGPIDVLLGADVYGLIIEAEIIKGNSTMPTAQLTIFGWALLGPVGESKDSRSYSMSFQVSHEEKIDEMLTKFWVQEEIPSTPFSSLTPEEQDCENHFKETVSRDSSGRYIVRLPLKAPVSQLGDSLMTASRFLSRLIQRLSKDETYQHLYSTFMDEYQELGHMRPAPSACSTSGKEGRMNSGSQQDGMTLALAAPAARGLRVPESGLSDSSHTPSYYLPHHGVLKEQSLTTKLRVVFNGSSKSTSGLSLNDIMHTGAKIQRDIIEVLLWVRKPKFLIATDITKMYRQILVHEDDWDLQRILWVDKEKNVIPYQLQTVTYGTRAAPFLAVRVLLQLLEDEGHNYPLAVDPILKGRYVDDIFAGSDTLQGTEAISRQLIELCKAGGFPLAKWSSNSTRLLQLIAPESISTSTSIDFEDSSIKLLGLSWNSHSDTFNFNVKPSSTSRVTKRVILSEVAQLFDPLGFLSPVIIRAKALLQQLWLEKLGWDDLLSPQLANKWIQFKEDLQEISTIKIPRWLQLTSATSIEIHGFSDASQVAMAAAIYFKVFTSNAEPRISLVCAKTKVAPLKPMTIPRLELSAALLLAKLVNYVTSTMNLENISTVLWTDSSVTLSWVNSHPSRWKDFVRNRVSSIQELVPHARWRFVPGKDNPADCASRGILPSQLRDHALWWSGPSWLQGDNIQWPSIPLHGDAQEKLEERPGLLLTVTKEKLPPVWDLIDRYSSLQRLLRITAILFRASARFNRTPDTSMTTPLNAGDLEHSRLHWIKLIQASFFHSELKALSQGEHLQQSHAFSRLTAFIDNQGILRVGGRLKHAELDSECKHPAILPRHSPLSTLVIADAHERTLHGGTKLTLAHVRKAYWILGGRAPIRSFILRCVQCTRYRGVRAQQLMGQLPPSRVTPSRAFLNSGIDYAGPVTLKTWRGRGAKTFKGWIAVFVCLSTSAVHLDVVTDYTAEAFIAAYRRFISRRGICKSLSSDCGTTFIGADAVLKELFHLGSTENERLAHLLLSDGTSWHFNPPSAPHFGGKWEAAVKSTKFHLQRTVQDTILTYEELTTLLSQIEAVLNSRPLEPLSDDPDDLAALTPGHFIIGEALNSVPEPSLESTPTSRLSHWQFIQQRFQYFWTKWSAEYLQRQQSISKWHHPNNNIKEGSMVLLTDERFPPSKWPLARVISVHPGDDGLVRVVTIKTATTTLQRPIAKLAVLPVAGSQPNS